MDVRCERCKARYAIPDVQITSEGLAVRCSACGHAFKVRRQQRLVLSAASQAEATNAIALARVDSTKVPLPEKQPEWILRRTDGTTMQVADLAVVQRLIAGGQAGRVDELSKDAGPFVVLGELPELGPILALVEKTSLLKPASGGTSRGRPAAPTPPESRSTGQKPPPDTRPDSKGPGAGSPRSAPSGATASASGDRSRSRWMAAIAVSGLLIAVAVVGAVVLWGNVEPSAPPRSPAAPAPEPVQPAAPPTSWPPASVKAAPPSPGPLPTPTPTPPPAPVALPPRPAQVAPQPHPPPAPQPPIQAAPPPVDRLQALRYRLAQARDLRERGETARALEAFQRLVGEEPNNVAALIGRGLCYFESNQYGFAVASFKQALIIAPDDPDATMGLAETFRQMGKLAEAVALYQRYLDAHPDGSEAAVARNALSQLKE